MEKIIILGAGYAGVLAAKKIEKKFKNNEEISITIIDKNPFHTMLTELHEVAADRVDEDSIKMSLKKIFAGRKVNVVMDNIEKVDFENKLIVGKNTDYPYDYLVVAAGSKPTYFGVEGAEKFSHKLWSYDDAVKLREHINESFRQAALETDIEKKKILLSFYVVGAGFTGVEMIGELAEYVPFLCHKHEIDQADVSLNNVDILPRTVPILPEKLSDKVENRLKKMNVNMILGAGVTGIGKDFIKVKVNNQEKVFAAGTVVWAAGIEGSDITNEVATKISSERRGRIKVDPFLRSLDDEKVFVIGDNMFYIPEGEAAPVPQMVENCEHSASIAAHNIFISITKNGEMKKYKPEFHGVMVSVGGRYAVARVGTPKMMINLPSFFAMLVKHLINIVYFIQVMGWTKTFSYLKHEFFTIRNNRSIVGGHFSNVTPSFLMVPLRVWLGAVWLFEGIRKVMEGWLDTPKLTDFFGGANYWYQSIINPQSAEAATDAVSAATAVVGAAGDAVYSAGQAIINWDIFGLLKVFFVSGKPLVDAGLSDFAFKIDIPILNSMLDKFIISSDGMQVFMQSFIVVAEIAIGLALIAGLFTFLSAGASVVLQMMFVTTTGLYLNTFWMIFAGIAVLIGAGRTIGLDYYVMPWLKKSWRNNNFARKWYLYHD